ncbi:hypothetical protein BH20ACT11_BH20ACT11_06390 [soil metagenome]
MRFEYHPDVDALYIHLNPDRKPGDRGGETVVVGDGVVVDVDATGAPVGIDIHQNASEIVDLSRLEVEGPVFGLKDAGGAGKRAS